MSALLDGIQAASELKKKIKAAVTEMTENGTRPPGLAVVLVGDDPASKIYVTNKRKACEEMGFKSQSYDLSPQVSEEELVNLINKLNKSPLIDGILVQLPLPVAINPSKIIECIDPLKDVDGFHPYNLGRLAQRNPFLRPCTSYGIIQLLRFYQIPIEGQHAVIIGASNIVGRPTALEFLAENATVTVCHRHTRDLQRHVKSADILVVATGVPDVINCEWLHKEQVVLDVGIHRLPNGKLRGDVDFERAVNKVAWLTPVPGGIGPMTIACLLQNTLFAALQSHSKKT